MDRLCLCFCLVFFMVAPLNAQQFGVSLGYGTSSSILGDLFYGTETNRFHLGLTYQIRSARGKRVTDQLPNYGQTIEGTGSYYLGAELGFGHVFKNHLTLTAELTLASKTDYTNYIDGRFTDGGYHMIDLKYFTAVDGLNLGYIFLESFEIFAGYNTLRRFSAGFRVLLW